MFTLFSHAGHAHDMKEMSAIDHCMPIIVGAAFIIAILLGVIAYLLVTREVKQLKKSDKKPALTTKNKK